MLWSNWVKRLLTILPMILQKQFVRPMVLLGIVKSVLGFRWRGIFSTRQGKFAVSKFDVDIEEVFPVVTGYSEENCFSTSFVGLEFRLISTAWCGFSLMLGRAVGLVFLIFDNVVVNIQHFNLTFVLAVFVAFSKKKPRFVRSSIRPAVRKES